MLRDESAWLIDVTEERLGVGLSNLIMGIDTPYFYTPF